MFCNRYIFYKMNRQQNGFHFVIYPKTLQVKGIHNDSKLPHFSISILKGNFQEDSTTIVPMRQQKLYHTYFLLNNGKLQFTEQQNINDCEDRAVLIYDQNKQLGDFHLKIDQYISNYEDYNSKYYNQKIKLSDNIDFQFELYMARTYEELSQLLLQYRGQSHIRTPITQQSRQNKEEDDFDSIFRNTKNTVSQIYSPAVLSVPKRSEGQEIDQEESVVSEIPLTAPPVLSSGFKISLKAVTPPSEPAQIIESRSQNSGKSSFTEYFKIPLKDKLLFSVFAIISIAMIYISMIPMKKI